MKKTYLTLISIIIYQLLFSQNFQLEFQKYSKENDTINQLKVLMDWEKNNPKDAELFTSYLNYHYQKSENTAISITSEQLDGEGFVLRDSLNKNVGYIGSQTHYNLIEINRGIEKINEGIKLYPNRLDMRFGKIFILGQIKDWDNFTKEIIQTIQLSSKNNNEWTWTNNEKRSDGKEFMLAVIQDYQLELYNTERDDLLENMQNIANEILKIYPNHVESLSNLSITYLLTEQYDKGIEALLTAEKIAPSDFIVLSNIAHGYKLKGDNKKAIEYYEKTIKHGDQQAKEFAADQINELKNKK